LAARNSSTRILKHEFDPTQFKNEIITMPFYGKICTFHASLSPLGRPKIAQRFQRWEPWPGKYSSPRGMKEEGLWTAAARRRFAKGLGEPAG